MRNALSGGNRGGNAGGGFGGLGGGSGGSGGEGLVKKLTCTKATQLQYESEWIILSLSQLNSLRSSGLFSENTGHGAPGAKAGDKPRVQVTGSGPGGI